LSSRAPSCFLLFGSCFGFVFVVCMFRLRRGVRTHGCLIVVCLTALHANYLFCFLFVRLFDSCLIALFAPISFSIIGLIS
jgi:hypothetical protein